MFRKTWHRYLFFLLLIGCFQHPFRCHAQEEKTELDLVAHRDRKETIYIPATRMVLRYRDIDGKIRKMRGVVSPISEDTLRVFHSADNMTVGFIAVHDLVYLRRVRPYGRVFRGALALAATIIALRTLPLIGSDRSDFKDGAFVVCLVLAPAMALSVPTSWLVERANQKKYERGWRFTVQKMKVD